MSNKIPAFISLIVGAALLAGSAYMYEDTQKLISGAGKAAGVVVDFERRSTKDGSTDYPVIEFTDSAGVAHRFTTSGAADFAAGETVEVLYDANDPASAKASVFIELWLGSLALGGFGVLCLLVGIASLYYARSRDAKPRNGVVL